MNDLQNALKQLKRRADGQRQAMPPTPKEAQALLDERDALLVALEQIACLDEEHTRAKEAINDALGIARAALAKTRNEEA